MFRKQLNGKCQLPIVLSCYCAVVLAAPWLGCLSASAAEGPVIQEPERSDFERSLEYVGVAVEEPGYHVWGCSPVAGPEEKTHLFAARWPKSTGFRPGWFTSCEIAHYVADTPEGPFKFVDVAVKGTGNPEDWDYRAPHNPTVHKVGNKYVLLYIGNNGTDTGSPGWQRTGMRVSDSLYGPWKKAGDNGLVIKLPEDRSWWNYAKKLKIVNPAFLQHPDGRFLIYFKSTGTRKGVPGRNWMGVAVSDNLEGPYTIEKDPAIFNEKVHEDAYALMMDGKPCLLTTGSKHHIRKGTGLLWSSEDGLKFTEEPKVAFLTLKEYLPVDVDTQGAKHFRGEWNFQRPQILMKDGRAAYFYAPTGVNLKARGNDDAGSVCFVLKCNWDRVKEREQEKE